MQQPLASPHWAVAHLRPTSHRRSACALQSTDLEQVAEQAVVDAVAQTAGDRATSSSAAAGSREVDPIKEGSRKYRRTVGTSRTPAWRRGSIPARR